MKKILIFVSFTLLLTGCSKTNHLKQQSADTDSVNTGRSGIAEMIPLTAANVNGHKMLYNEGFFVITSSEKAFAYAADKSVQSSGAAIAKIAESVVARTKTLKGTMGGRLRASYERAEKTLRFGTGNTVKIMKATGGLAKGQLDYSKATFNEAWKMAVYGNISLVERTEKDVAKLVSLPGDYYQNIKGDFSNIALLSGAANSYVGEKVNLSWNRSFKDASRLFNDEYERSGKKENAFLALGNILNGYLKIIYYGLISPSAKTIVTSGAKGVNYGLFLPASATTVVTGRVVESTGLSLYYATKTGYKLVTPTVGAGVLSGISVLSLGSAPVTYLGGTSFGAVNQVAFTMASPMTGVGEGIAASSGGTGKYVALVTCDIATGTSKVLINQASAGIVLGYNALTAVPAHLFLGSIDTAVFLAWDGPRLVVAVASGKMNSEHSVGALPAGTVVDLKRLKQHEGIDVNVVTDDPAVVGEIMEKISEDLRGKSENE